MAAQKLFDLSKPTYSGFGSDGLSPLHVFIVYTLSYVRNIIILAFALKLLCTLYNSIVTAHIEFNSCCLSFDQYYILLLVCKKLYIFVGIMAITRFIDIYKALTEFLDFDYQIHILEHWFLWFLINEYWSLRLFLWYYIVSMHDLSKFFWKKYCCYGIYCRLRSSIPKPSIKTREWNFEWQNTSILFYKKVCTCIY